MSTTYGWETEPQPAGDGPQPPAGNRPGGITAALRLATIGVAICLIGLIGGLGIGWSLARSRAVTTTAAQGPIAAVPQTGAASAQPAGSTSLAALAAKVDPFVVDVNTVIQSANGSGARPGPASSSPRRVRC